MSAPRARNVSLHSTEEKKLVNPPPEHVDEQKEAVISRNTWVEFIAQVSLTKFVFAVVVLLGLFAIFKAYKYYFAAAAAASSSLEPQRGRANPFGSSSSVYVM